MTDRLSVDLDLLDDFGNRLDGIRKALDSSKSDIRSHDSDFGSTKVRDAMHHFESHWKDGRQHVEDTADSLASMVHESVKTFRKTDADLKQQLLDAEQQK